MINCGFVNLLEQSGRARAFAGTVTRIISSAALTSLSTGSSYGTFAILMAIAVPVGFELGASMHQTIAAIRSGGLMGDHASPISDSPVLASVGAHYNHLSHVTTQGAYALLTGMVTSLAYWMAGVYETPYVLFVAIIVLFISMTLAMRFFGEEVIPTCPNDSLTAQ